MIFYTNADRAHQVVWFLSYIVYVYVYSISIYAFIISLHFYLYQVRVIEKKATRENWNEILQSDIFYFLLHRTSSCSKLLW